MAQLSITNVINISVSAAQQGVGQYNVNNLALFTHDAFANSFGTAGYALYLDPTQVGVDFGTSSETFAMANAVFSQQPNILAGGGYLAVIPFEPNIQTLAFSGIPASGSFHLIYGAQNITVTATESAASIQTALQALTGLSQVLVSGSLAGESLTITMYGVYNPTTLTTGTNTLETSGSTAITITVTQTQAYETLGEAVSRTASLVQYFGIITDRTVDLMGSVDTLASAAVIQPLNKIAFLASHQAADIAPGGLLDQLRTGDLTQSRGLYYGSSTFAPALVMAASYAGRALSTNFSGSNTTETMHLKDLNDVQPDPTITQTLLNQAIAAGADTYISLQGVPKVFTSGTNSYFDQVYNLQWLVGALQVAGFNYLAESATKVPQTESGMTGLKGAYRAICQEAVGNQYLAPGQWNSSTTFGNQVDFLLNIGQVGYYIYSTPVSQQAQADRAARIAPLVQIAIKEAGAIQESSVVIYVNA